MTIHRYAILIRLKNGIARRRKWLVLALIVAAFYWIPLGEYLLSVGRSVFDHGISSQTVKEIGWHNNWLKRYFTGPPSDDEMRAFFQKHRASFERMAYLFATEQCVSTDDTTPQVNTCEVLGKEMGVQLMYGGTVQNSIYRQQGHRICNFPCQIQRYEIMTRDQNWWRNTNPDITAWIKSFIYIPPLHPNQASDSQNQYPADRDAVMQRKCRFPKNSLDRPIPELMEQDGYSDDCGYFALENGWYVSLWASYRMP
jgi:hypothetical protein